MRIKQWLNRLWGCTPANPIDSVETNATGIDLMIESRRVTVPWEKVISIAVQHLGGTGDSERTYYLLNLEDRVIRISVLASGMNDFIRRLQVAPDLRRRDYLLAVSAGNEYPVTIWDNPLHRTKKI